MIELINITKTYKDKKNTVEALKGISTVFPDIGMVFIVGKSGGGKSTLLNILGGLDTCDGGDFLIDGVSTKNFTNSNWDSYRNHFVGFVFQDHHLMHDYTVRENIGFALALQNKNKDESKDENKTESQIEQALKTVDLEGYGGRNIKKLSGGQRQRVAIARALVKECQMLLADEPTGNLDRGNAKEIFNLLKEISKTKLVVVVTHDVNAANAYADMAFRINDGKITDTAALPEANDQMQKEAIAVSVPKNNATAALSSCEQNNLPQTELKKQQLVFEKTKLSSCAVFQIIGRICKLNIFKLVVTVLVSVLALLMFCSAFKYLTWNPYDAQARSMKVESTSIISTYEYKKNADNIDVKSGRNFNAEDLKIIQTQFPQDAIFKVYQEGSSFSLVNELIEYQKAYYSSRVNGICRIDKSGIESLGYTLLAGEYPSESWQDTDILITKYRYELLALCGFYDAQGKSVTVENYSDVIGKTVRGNDVYTIRGIIDTHMPDEKLAEVKKYANEKITEPNSYVPSAKAPNEMHVIFSQSYITDENVHKLLFQKIGTQNESEMQYLLLPNNNATNMQKAKFIMDSDCFTIEGYYANEIETFIDITKKNGVAPAIFFIILFIGLALSVFLISNFIVSGIKETKAEIGILRCVGASKKDILKIYSIFTELFVGAIFVVSLLLFTFACVPYLSFFDVPSFFFPFQLYVLNVFDIVALFGLLGIVSGAALTLPLLNVFKKTPIQILTD